MNPHLEANLAVLDEMVDAMIAYVQPLDDGCLNWEPLPETNPLWDMPNVIVSPHSASTVAAENGRIVDLFLDNLDRFLDGRPLKNLFDPARGY